MMRVIFVFVAQRRLDKVRRNFFQRRPNPKFLVGTKRDPQQFAVAVTHALGKRNPIKQRRLWQRQPNCNENCTKNNSVAKRAAQIANYSGAPASSRRRPASCGTKVRGRMPRTVRKMRALPRDCRPRTHSVTVIFPPTPRPLTLRSYMDCANTGGTMNWPRLHDLIW